MKTWIKSHFPYIDIIVLLPPLFKLWMTRSTAKSKKLECENFLKRNWVFTTNSDFIIHLSLEPNVVNFWYFKLLVFDLTEFIVLKYLRSTTSELKDIGFRKAEFVAKTQFLLIFLWKGEKMDERPIFNCFQFCKNYSQSKDKSVKCGTNCILHQTMYILLLFSTELGLIETNVG